MRILDESKYEVSCAFVLIVLCAGCNSTPMTPMEQALWQHEWDHQVERQCKFAHGADAWICQ